jgi:hypothetical protein
MTRPASLGSMLILLSICAFAVHSASSQSVCDKCNKSACNGGCKCDANCNCKAGTGGAACDKCNIPVANGGCKCDTNCNCKAGTCGGGSVGGGGGGGGGATLYQGTGSGTYYFDVRTTACGSFPESNGYPLCTSNTPGPNQQTLAQLNSNNVVAINANLIGADRAKFCGKRIRVFKNGVEVAAPDGGNFFVWDGCAACASNSIIDFSFSGLRQISSDACNQGVVPGITWTVVDEVVRTFVA